ncbi:tetratricopeptide repeat protein [Sphingomonas sp.]|uniref:tetratricopeptide repeat protein n=1 Tax=Sphingomonas sp. TaxID=28214 RepID=UPI002FC6432F
MRVSVLALLVAAAVPASIPAAAQERSIERRVDVIEKELRAVQRKVFPGGAGAVVEAEISAEQAPALESGFPASSALADLTARVDSLEAQLRTLTGQSEENAHRLRLLEASVTQLRADAEARASEAAAPSAAASPSPTNGERSASTARNTPSPAAAAAPNRTPNGAPDEVGTGDAGEEAYTAGYRLWNDQRYAEAQKALEATVKKYPKHASASRAQNLLGRAYLDDGKPAAAAKVFLANYQNNPKGERAPDSLYFLGQALVQLKKTAEACKVYDELQDVYGSAMRDWVKQRLPKARADAKCG